jgi:membrane protein YdbS with pleckstrin-like domain
LWAIRVKNIQHDNGEPLNDHQSHDSLIALSCIVMMCAAILVIWLIAGIAVYIVGYCKDLSQNKIMNNLLKFSLIFELIKYIFVIPLIKFNKK